MAMKKPSKKSTPKKKRIPQAMPAESSSDYDSVLSDIVDLLENARRAAVRSVNAVITATYWEMGRRIVEQDQKRAKRAKYGQQLIIKLSADLSARFGRGFSERNLEQMRRFFLSWPIPQALPAESSAAPLSRIFKSCCRRDHANAEFRMRYAE
jgi:DUF1016 N-terminal domain